MNKRCPPLIVIIYRKKLQHGLTRATFNWWWHTLTNYEMPKPRRTFEFLIFVVPSVAYLKIDWYINLSALVAIVKISASEPSRQIVEWKILLMERYLNHIECRFGIPQGKVIGPLLFLILINNISQVVSKGTTRMFADESLVYQTIHSSDQTLLCKNLNSLHL